MNVYVASSWANPHQPTVVRRLRAEGHTVYDFKDADGFHWSEVDPEYERWSSDPDRYLVGLDHEAARRGFHRDMNALSGSHAVVYVMPCGVSSSWEAGWAVGAGKRVIVYVPELVKPDLMVKMAHLVTRDLEAICRALRTW